MAEAKHVIEILSREPSAQRIAEMRREAEIFRRLDRAEDLAQGRAEGKAEARAEARAEGKAEGAVQTLRRHIAKLCENRGVELTGPRLTQLESWEEKQLDAAFDSLLNQRAWPTDLNE